MVLSGGNENQMSEDLITKIKDHKITILFVGMMIISSLVAVWGYINEIDSLQQKAEKVRQDQIELQKQLDENKRQMEKMNINIIYLEGQICEKNNIHTPDECKHFLGLSP